MGIGFGKGPWKMGMEEQATEVNCGLFIVLSGLFIAALCQMVLFLITNVGFEIASTHRVFVLSLQERIHERLEA